MREGEKQIKIETQEFESKIRELVGAINALGVKTFWSCEGHKEFKLTGAPVPTVAINLKDSPPEAISFEILFFY